MFASSTNVFSVQVRGPKRLGCHGDQWPEAVAPDDTRDGPTVVLTSLEVQYRDISGPTIRTY